MLPFRGYWRTKARCMGASRPTLQAGELRLFIDWPTVGGKTGQCFHNLEKT